MKPYVIDIDPATSDPDGLADNNSSAGATLTLDGVLTSAGTFTSADGLGHQISITDTATQDQSDSTFTITGTDADGLAISEAVTGPGSGATVVSSLYFYTISGIAIAGGDANDTVDCGTVAGGEVETKTYFVDGRSSIAAGCQTVVTGTINYTISGTMRNLHADSDVSSAAFTAITAFSAKTADVLGEIPRGVEAIRITTASYTDTAEVQVYVNPIHSD